jgi:hypothetical protein
MAEFLRHEHSTLTLHSHSTHTPRTNLHIVYQGIRHIFILIICFSFSPKQSTYPGIDDVRHVREKVNEWRFRKYSG